MRKELSLNASLNNSIGPSKRNSLSKNDLNKTNTKDKNELNNDLLRYSMSFASPRDQDKINLVEIKVNHFNPHTQNHHY